MVRRPDGQMIAFRELTTLQKWIVEGRINREDEISKNGETWKRLGNIMELEPFFSVYEKAQALNRMVDHGAPVAPAAVRGSDVLASYHPHPTSSLAQPILSHAGPTSSLHHRPLDDGQLLPPPVPPLTRPAMPTVHPRVADARPAMERSALSSYASGTGLPGPGALDPEPAPAAFGTSSLDMPDQVLSGPDVVADFRRSRRRAQWTLAAAVLVFLGIGVGAGVAAYGPKDNPLRAFANRYVIQRAEQKPKHPDMSRALEALERDTEASRKQALDLLANLHNKHPTDAVVASWRAYAAAWTALSEQQVLADLQAANASGPRIARAAEKTRASRLATQAADWLRAVQDAQDHPRELGLARGAVALALGKNEAAKRALDELASVHTEHQGDPQWLHLAAATTMSERDPTPDALKQADTRLRTATTLKPKLIRAHVLLARVAHRRSDVPLARKTIDDVLQQVPEHEEAKRLKKAWAPPPPPPPAKKPAPRTFEEWMSIGDRARERNRTQAALNAYGRASELDTASALPQIGKGWCLLDLDKPRVALAAFERAQQADPDNAETYYGIAESQKIIGNTQKALAAYETFLAKAPQNDPERRAVQSQIDRLKKP